MAAGDWWDRIDIGKGGEVTIVPAYHWSARTGRDRRMALWCGFMLSTVGGRVHFTGDTGYGDGRIFRETRQRIGRPDLALIPIGAYAPRWFMSAQHTDPNEAVQILEDLEAARAVGIHWGVFRLTDERRDEPPELLLEALARRGIAAEPVPRRRARPELRSRLAGVPLQQIRHISRVDFSGLSATSRAAQRSAWRALPRGGGSGYVSVTGTKSVQDYLDELPTWSDGTHLKAAPMTGMQWRIWSLAAAGKFFEGFVVFMTGVALPLIAREFGIASAQKGIISAASLAGILFGAVLLGGLSDYFGRKRMFVAEMIIFVAFLALLIVSTSFVALAICLFGLGLALGCDYPTAHMVISENIPSANRGKLVLGAFGFQALGALAGTGVGSVVLIIHPTLSAWRWMYATAMLPALAITIARFFVVESANWLAVRGDHEEAEKSVIRLLRRVPQYPTNIQLARNATSAHGDLHSDRSFWALFNRRNRRATIFASLPWFIQDLSTYGIGIFTPVILAAAIGGGPDHVRSLSDLITSDIIASKGAALIDILLLVGIAFAVVLADRVGRIKLQIFGFIGCAAGLLLASFSADVERRVEDRADLHGLHAVRLHDQPRSQRSDLPPGGRSVSDRGAGHGRGVRRGVRQDRRGGDGVPVSHPAGRYRHARAALWAGRRLAPGRLGDLALAHRDHRCEPG